MLRLGVTQELFDEGEIPRERTKKIGDSRGPMMCWQRPHRRVFRVYTSMLASDESLGHQHMGAVYHRGSSQIASTSESHGGDLIILRWSKGARKRRRVRRGSATQKAKHRLERRWTRRSTTVPQRRIYRSRRKGCRCKATDSRAMGLVAPWYHRCGTFVESSIPCSHGGRALVVKGAEKVKNAKTNSKYQDRVEGQRPKNFIRPVSMAFSSR
ncbi:hypothetical protein BHE74_00017473 [Ensete ventricosum]|nr:hypothetical protein BHE74_00017473 [Ensete ventricosum]